MICCSICIWLHYVYKTEQFNEVWVNAGVFKVSFKYFKECYVTRPQCCYKENMTVTMVHNYTLLCAMGKVIKPE